MDASEAPDDTGLLPTEESGLIPYAKLAYGHFFESRKDDLTRWWLQLIEKSTDSFLRSLGYDFDAVPFHYIDQPPRSMPVILKNLQMIRFLLKASGKNLDSGSLPMRRHLLDGLVNPLKRVIYSRIDEYAHSVMLFLWNECNSLLGLHLADTDGHLSFAPSAMPPCTATSDRKGKGRASGADDDGVLVPCADLESIKERLQRTDTIPEGRRKVLLSLLGDIHYIDEMKRLEQDFFGDPSAPPQERQKKSPPSDIVPVTGLIVGKLHRLENELKTVVEHWSRRGL
ncbi:uncharacterized protein ACA1_339910 [Acanthamoeba castellanii str. Neff]|uniref:Uncharacterized protein n=1 Tax=Acanthamoeba castellanii (strain ATCC 30010 / Neff) TaxID=1257118 RepID=L8GKJ1_ACACF|nr:uncharacterized protein ACA1_339910 [Acanthamoeba castellanii str. Neff]ELR13243.1 hypothetical protein ACA1_339910 [Acanthamoeba castellanii str. Neff]